MTPASLGVGLTVSAKTTEPDRILRVATEPDSTERAYACISGLNAAVQTELLLGERLLCFRDNPLLFKAFAPVKCCWRRYLKWGEPEALYV